MYADALRDIEQHLVLCENVAAIAKRASGVRHVLRETLQLQTHRCEADFASLAKFAQNHATVNVTRAVHRNLAHQFLQQCDTFAARVDRGLARRCAQLDRMNRAAAEVRRSHDKEKQLFAFAFARESESRTPAFARLLPGYAYEELQLRNSLLAQQETQNSMIAAQACAAEQLVDSELVRVSTGDEHASRRKILADTLRECRRLDEELRRLRSTRMQSYVAHVLSDT